MQRIDDGTDAWRREIIFCDSGPGKVFEMIFGKDVRNSDIKKPPKKKLKRGPAGTVGSFCIAQLPSGLSYDNLAQTMIQLY